jgi:hypothetical protein
VELPQFLIKDDRGWRLIEKGDAENVDLAVAIGKAIGLRYFI